jgi:hypothetical protein
LLRILDPLGKKDENRGKEQIKTAAHQLPILILAWRSYLWSNRAYLTVPAQQDTGTENPERPCHLTILFPFAKHLLALLTPDEILIVVLAPSIPIDASADGLVIPPVRRGRWE